MWEEAVCRYRSLTLTSRSPKAHRPACNDSRDIRVAQLVIDHRNHGWSADEICIHYPHLKPAEVHSAMAYYFDHQAEIDGEIENEQRLIAESPKNAKPTPAELRLCKGRDCCRPVEVFRLLQGKVDAGPTLLMSTLTRRFTISLASRRRCFADAGR